MQTLLVEAGIITLYTVAHLQVDSVIIYSVMYISPFTNYDVLYIYIYIYIYIYMTFCVLCAP